MSGGYRKRGTQRSYRRLQGLVPSYRGYAPRQFSRGEWKFLDTTINTAADTTGTMTLLNGLAPGNSASERVGMKVSIQSIEIRLRNQVTGGTGVDQIQRLILLQDRQANGIAPAALTDFLNAGNYQGLRNLAQRKRFRILKDYYFTLNATAEPGSQKCIHKYMKFRRPIVTEFNAGVAGTIADISTNSLFFVCIGSIAAGGTAGTCAGYIRIRYTDI